MIKGLHFKEFAGFCIILASAPASLADSIHTNTPITSNKFQINQAGIKPKDTVSTWLALSLEGKEAFDRGDFYLAKSLIKKALHETELSEESRYRRVSSWRQLATIYQIEGNFKEAEIQLRQAISLLQNTPPGPVLADSLEDLAHTLAAQEKFDEADKVFQRSLKIQKNSPLQWKALTGHTLSYGNLYERRGDHKRAEQLYKQALTFAKTYQRNGSQQEAECLASLCNLYTEKDRLSESASLCKFIAEAHRTNKLPKSDCLYRAIQIFASKLCQQKKWRQGEAYFKSCIEGMRSQTPPTPDLLFHVQYSFAAECYEPQKKYKEAELIYTQLLPTAAKPVQIVKCFLGLGNVYSGQNNLNKATEFYKKAVDFPTKNSSNLSNYIPQANYQLGLIYLRQDQFGLAKKYLQKSLDLFVKQFGPNALCVADNLCNLAGAEEATGNLRQAEIHLKKALSIYQVILKEDDPALLNMLTPYIRVLKKLHHNKEANKYEQQSCKITTKCLGKQKS